MRPSGRDCWYRYRCWCWYWYCSSLDVTVDYGTLLYCTVDDGILDLTRKGNEGEEREEKTPRHNEMTFHRESNVYRVCRERTNKGSRYPVDTAPNPGPAVRKERRHIYVGTRYGGSFHHGYNEEQTKKALVHHCLDRERS